MGQSQHYGPELLQPGSDVVTAAVLGGRDYTASARANRRPGAHGKVVGICTGHGLCYEVRHEDGTVGFYDPDEITRSAT